MERIFFFPEAPSYDLAAARRALAAARETGGTNDREVARLMRETIPSRFFAAFGDLLPPRELARRYERLRPFLGRNRPLWDHVIHTGRRLGLLPAADDR